MKFIIHGKCRECGFEGLAKDVYKHGEKTHGHITDVDLDKQEILNALIQLSIKAIVENALDKGEYDSIADSLADWEGNDVYNIIDEECFGDNVVDVLDSLKSKDSLIRKQFQEHLKNFKIVLQEKQNIEDVSKGS